MFDYYSQVDHYLAGKLEGEQLIKFEERLKIDTELEAVVKNHPLYLTIADGIIESQIRKSIATVEQKSKSAFLTKAFALVSIFVVGCVALFLFNKKNKPPEKKIIPLALFEKYYFAPETEVYRGERKVENDPLKNNCFEAHAYLDIGEIAKSKSSLELLKSNDPNMCDGLGHYLLGMIALKEGDIQAAVNNLDHVAANASLDSLKLKAKNLLDELKIQEE